MPGDELHEEATGPAKAVAGARRERTGPRHAAPKKPFLTRLHVPAGKAVAIAAMPSAVLMSMGITPQLAYAKPLPKNPFGDGPCVSQQDKAEEEARQEAAAEAERKAEEAREREEAERRAEEEKKEQEAAEEAESSTSGGSSGDGSTDGGSSDASGGTGDSGTESGTAEPEPEPSPSEEGDDGLLGGLLGGVGDALGGDGEQEQTDASAEPSPSETPEVSAGDAADSAQDAADGAEDAVDDVRKDLDDTVGKVEDTVEDATGRLPDTSVDDATEQLPGAEETEPVTGADGERAFPCVEEKKVAGTDEQTPTTLPNQPWTLKASSLTIRGQDYEGVFNVRTANGETKQVLKFTADSVDIGDLHQIVQGPNGTLMHVKAAPGSTSTIRDGQVTLYTERLEGKLFGLIPIVFDPEHPPPLNIPNVHFTDVTVQQAGQFGGTLTVPGLTSTITDG